MARNLITKSAGSLLGWIGGGISKTAAAGIVGGALFLATGMNAPQYFVSLWLDPPSWLAHPVTRIALILVGLIVIFVSLRFNVWSKKQMAIDDLSEDIAWAIRNLLNNRPTPADAVSVEQWETRFRKWYKKVSSKLENRAFFTKADQLHFDYLGFVEPVEMEPSTTEPSARLNWLLSQLRMKFERLREIIQWAQQRRR